jgi:adenosylcobinamide amidohydrolase
VGYVAGSGKAITAAKEARAPASDFQPVDKHVGHPGVGAGRDGVPIHSAGWKV